MTKREIEERLEELREECAVKLSVIGHLQALACEVEEEYDDLLMEAEAWEMDIEKMEKADDE